MELETFDSIFALIVDELSKFESDSNIEECMRHFRKVLEYNVPHGKKNRGVSVVSTYRILMKKSPHIPEEDVQLATILGWCVELLQAFFLVADDIMDNSITRRGQPCWYRNKGVGMMAINDSFFLESAIYVLLKTHFSGLPCYVNLLELFHEVTMQTVTGQCLDIMSSQPDAPLDFSQFTMERYSTIVKYKTAYYSFYLPVALAMYLAGIYDKESHERAKVILLEMGHFFQVQDDFLDCYADPEVLGKIGTDIQDRKCGWLIIQALRRCNDTQRKVLEENYGVDEPECIQRVKDVYNGLQLDKVFADYENECYQRINELIERLSENLPKEIFIAFFNKIFKRAK